LEILVSHDEILIYDREEFLDFRLGIKFLKIILSPSEYFLEVWLHELNILANHLQSLLVFFGGYVGFPLISGELLLLNFVGHAIREILESNELVLLEHEDNAVE